jgi:membrane associated rhomboid family serine protease
MPSLQSFGVPRFTRAVRQLVIVCVTIFLLGFLLQKVAPNFWARMLDTTALVPYAVLHGYPGMPIPHIWQLVTYSFLHGGVMHILFNMLSLWLFGATLEEGWGYRKFLEFYFFCVAGAGLLTMAASYAGLLGLRPEIPTIGASGGIYGLIVAFGIIYAEMRVFVMGVFPIKAKWFAVIWVAIAVLMGDVAHLGGAAFGFIYVKFMPRGGFSYLFSEKYYGVRNSFHRYKRKQAAKKFEVYMGKVDRKQYFDEHGNYREPEDKQNGDGGGGKWVN